MNLSILVPIFLELIHSISHSNPSSNSSSLTTIAFINRTAPNLLNKPNITFAPLPKRVEESTDLLNELLRPDLDYDQKLNSENEDEDIDGEVLLDYYEPTREELETKNRLEVIRQLIHKVWTDFRLSYLEKGQQSNHSITSTVASALSTLWISESQQEFYQGKRWLESEDTASAPLSSQPIPESLVGSLLSCYALSGDRMCLKRAKQLADFRIKRSQSINENDQLEYRYLYGLTGDARYLHQLEQFASSLKHSHKATKQQQTLLGLKDQLMLKVKSYLHSSGNDPRPLTAFRTTIDRLDSNEGRKMVEVGRQVCLTSPPDLMPRLQLCRPTAVYVRGMGATDCDLGAMFALGASGLMRQQQQSSVPTKKRSSLLERISRYLQLAEHLTETCHHMANTSADGLPATEFTAIDQSLPSTQPNRLEDTRALTETYLTLWRLTHQVKYRQYAWQLTEAIVDKLKQMEKSLSLESIESLLGGTLKHLYLTYSAEHLISLDHWVFNRYGAPLPICHHDGGSGKSHKSNSGDSGSRSHDYPDERCKLITV